MRSIPLALSWQFWRRGAPIASAAALGMIAFLLLLYGALRMAGLRSFDNDVGRDLHFSLCLMWIVGCISITAQVNPTFVQNFTLPVRSVTLVAWTMLHGMLAPIASYVIAALVVNTTFDARWPLWVPALFIAAVAAWGHAVMWGLRSSAFCQVVSGAIAVFASIWWFNGIVHSEANAAYGLAGVTALDLFGMLAAIVVAFGLCVWGVSRDRCGEGPSLKRIADWLESLFDRLFRHGEEFGSRTQALFLFEWKLKGLAFPLVAVVVSSVVVFWFFVWAVDAQAVVDVCTALSGMAVMLGFGLGAVMGQSSDDLSLGNFKATRPATDTEMAFAVLKATAAAIFAGWAVWLLALAMMALCFIAAGQGGELAYALTSALVLGNIGLWSVPMYLCGVTLAIWAAAALTASACLSRMWLVLWVIYLFSMAVFILVLGLRFFVSETVHQTVWMVLIVILALGAIGGTVAAFVFSFRWHLIDGRTVVSAAFGTAVLCGISCALLFSHGRLAPFSTLVSVGAMCLPFAPLAIAPLAVRWKRHR